MFILSSLLGSLLPMLASLKINFLLKIFCVTKTRQDKNAHVKPIKLLEKVNVQARMTPRVNGSRDK